MDLGEKSLLEKTTIDIFFSNINKDRKETMLILGRR